MKIWFELLKEFALLRGNSPLTCDSFVSKSKVRHIGYRLHFTRFLGCASAPVKETLVEADTGQIVFKSITIDDAVFYRGGTKGTEARASGQLTFPDRKDKVPAVILIHGSNGVCPSERGWAKELNKLGLATFVVDSFSLRGISSTFRGAQSLGTGSSIFDGYRALELLSNPPENRLLPHLPDGVLPRGEGCIGCCHGTIPDAMAVQ